MIDLRKRSLLANAFAAIACALAFSAAQGSPLPLIVVIAAALASWPLFRETSASPAPRWALNLAVAVAALWLLRLRIVELDAVVGVIGEFLIWLIVIKLFENRTQRDQGQLLALAGMLLISATLMSVNLILGLTLLIALPALCWAVVLLQIAGPTLPAKGINRSANLRTAPLLGIVTLGFSTTLVLAAALFIAMPRGLGEGIIGSWNPQQANPTTGFRDHVQLGTQGAITESFDIVMTAEILADAANRIHAPSAMTHYLRGAVLNQYDSRTGTWRRTTTPTSVFWAPLNPTKAPTFPSPPPSNTKQWEISVRLLSKRSPQLFSLQNPTSAAINRDIRRLWVNRDDGEVRAPRLTGPTEYALRGIHSFPTQLEPDAVEKDPTPFIDTPIQEIAQRVIDSRGLTTDSSHAAIATALRDHLSEAYLYTLELDARRDGEDPIVMFLTRTQRGHCEYFASALVSMLRSLAVPARYVVGYVATEYDDDAKAFTIRESHAHAWTEVQHDDGTWHIYDPSPREQIRAYHQPTLTLAQRFQRYITSIESFWATEIINFDSENQADILGSDAEDPLGLTALSERLQASSDQERDRQSWLLSSIMLIGKWLIVAIAGSIAIASLPRLIRALAPRLARRAPADQQLRLLNTIERTLEKLGHPRPPATPGLVHAEQLTMSSPALASAARRARELRYTIRFEGRPLTPDEASAARGILRELRATRSA